MEEVKDVKTDPSSALVEAIASSPEVQEEAQQTQGTETPTPNQGVSQEQQEEQVVQEEESRVPYSRLKEVVDEKNWFKQQLEQQMAQRQQVLQQPHQDPYANMTAEEKVFWQGIDQRIEKRASEIADVKLQGIQPMLNAGVKEITMMKVQQFRKAHPDIKANSPEEIEIAGLISQGVDPDKSYWAIMGERGARNATTQVKQQFKQQVAAKRQANVETSASIPSNAKPQPKLSFKEEMLQKLSKIDGIGE